MSADGMGAGGPSEAELQQMLAQMREAPAEQVLVEVINVLLQAVQVKLGRPDARLLLDAVAAVADSARGRADTQLVDQVSAAVAQLRLAQVEAEGGAGAVGARSDAASAPAATGVPAEAAGRKTRTPGGPTAGPSGGGGPGDPPGGGSRLWVPGR